MTVCLLDIQFVPVQIKKKRQECSLSQLLLTICLTVLSSEQKIRLIVSPWKRVKSSLLKDNVTFYTKNSQATTIIRISKKTL